MKKEFTFYIYNPGGNITALVEDCSISNKQKRDINTAIMRNFPDIQQVGFVSCNKPYSLMMAGNEFCGNATRCAAHYFLKGKKGKIAINVSGCDQQLVAGIDDNGCTWSQMPLYITKEFSMLENLGKGLSKIKMPGIEHIIILPARQSRDYIKEPNYLIENAKVLIEKYYSNNCEAVGVIYTEVENKTIKIFPIVYVKSINTLIYETSCGSGSISLAIQEAIKFKSPTKLEIMQPSGQILTAEVLVDENGYPSDAFIYGTLSTDNLKRKIVVDIEDVW